MSFFEQFNTLPIITQAFVLVVVALGVGMHLKFDTRAAAYGPSITTTIGIFATFLGIALGLHKFNPNDIQGSVPALLDGLKTAFWASVAGVGVAITLKCRHAYFGAKPSAADTKSHGATVDDLLHQLNEIKEALVGGEDSTLISQLKLGRQDSNDRLDALKRAQQEFMEKMAENNSKALIQALEEVMRDFNAKINEQFGENFKHLNAAVEKILVWQERYREQMEEMIAQQKQTSENMAIATDRYGTLLSRAEGFKDVAEKLSLLIEALSSQRDQIEKSLSSLGTLLKEASGSLPEIEKKIMELTAQITSGVKANNDETARAIKETSVAMTKVVTEAKTSFTDSVENLGKELGEMTSQMTNAVKSNNDETARAVKESSTAMTKVVADVKAGLTESVQSLGKEFTGHLVQSTERIQKQVETLDRALEKELTDSLNSLGRQLTALSRRFVDDYTPLTDRLRELVSNGRAV